MLLLDEPTNHLDLARISQLESWLNTLPRDMPVVIASHDRAFLDATTNRTLFLRPEQSQLFSLPYTKARVALREADAADERRFQRDLKTAQQLRKQAAKLNNIGINSGSDLLLSKTRQLKRAPGTGGCGKAGASRTIRGNNQARHRGTSAKVLVRLDDAAVETPDGRCCFETGKRFICKGDRSCCWDRTDRARRGCCRCCARLSGTGRLRGPASRSRSRWCSAMAIRRSRISTIPLRRWARSSAVSTSAISAPAPCSQARAHDRDAGPSGRPVVRRPEGAARHAGAAADQAQLLSARRADQPSRYRGAGSAGG